MCRSCQSRSYLALTSHACQSEAAGRRSSVPARSFAALRLTRTERLPVAALQHALSLSVISNPDFYNIGDVLDVPDHLSPTMVPVRLPESLFQKLKRAAAEERDLTPAEDAEQQNLIAAYRRSVLRRAKALAVLAQRGHRSATITSPFFTGLFSGKLTKSHQTW
jgi:hypothetical protein